MRGKENGLKPNIEWVMDKQTIRCKKTCRGKNIVLVGKSDCIKVLHNSVWLFRKAIGKSISNEFLSYLTLLEAYTEITWYS